MPQITIYLDPDTAARMEDSVKRSGLSKSRWIAEAVRQKTADEWPPSVRDLSGAWTEFPTLEEIRESAGSDAPREPV